jgi:hypothetical protein
MGDFINAHPELFPLHFTAQEAKRQIKTLERLAITGLQPGDTAYLNLRFFDGNSSAWFDALDLPKGYDYVVGVTVDKFVNKQRSKAVIKCATFNQSYTLSTYDIMAYTIPSHMLDGDQYIIVTPSTERVYPQIFR